MSSQIKASLFLVLMWSTLQLGSCLSCTSEGFFGIETRFDCPQAGQPESHIFCCGDDDSRYCCASPFGSDIQIDQETVDKLVESLPRIIGILVGVVLVVLLVCVVCCCCCPFCLLAKRRNSRGHVRNTDVTVSVPAQQGQPLQPYSQPQPYIQPQAYPAQPQPYIQPQPGYPQPGYPAAQPGFPAQPQPGYPTGTAAAPVAGMPAPGYPDQPPPYAEKQPAFNPNYGA